MTDTPSERETALAAHLISLQDKAARPRLSGSGPVFDVLNFISIRAPLTLVRAALVVFLAYMAWGYYMRAQQMVADLETKEAAATQKEVEAEALNTKVNNVTAQRATAKAELAKIEAEGATAEADAGAARAQIGGVPARLAALRAEMELARAEGDKAEAEADALNQLVDGVPLAVAQRKAEIAAATGEMRKSIQSLCGLLWGSASTAQVLRNVWNTNGSPNLAGLRAAMPTAMSCPGAR